MYKIKYFICDLVSVTKKMRPFQAKKNIKVHITMLVIYNVISETCSRKKNKQN